MIKEVDNLPMFVERDNVEDANKVNMKIYRFERYSQSRDVYIFVKRKVFF